MDDAQLVRVLKALAHPERFKIVREIAASGRELSCSEVGEVCPKSQPTVSHHTKILTDAGLIMARQEGKHRYISVNHELLAQVSGLLSERTAPVPPAPGQKATRAEPGRRSRRRAGAKATRTSGS
jgi:DNA-binding transcriptional ArsR family regulator